MFDVQPSRGPKLSLIKTNVKHPLGWVDVKGPGIVVPQYPPARPPGTLPAGFPLEINGELVLGPS